MGVHEKMRALFGAILGIDIEDIIARESAFVHVVRMPATDEEADKLINGWVKDWETMNDRVEETIKFNDGKPVGIWYHISGVGSNFPIKIGYCKFLWKSWEEGRPEYNIPYPPELWFTAEFMDQLEKQTPGTQKGYQRDLFIPGWHHGFTANNNGDLYLDKCKIVYEEPDDREIVGIDENANLIYGEGRAPRKWVWELDRDDNDEAWDQETNCIRGRWKD